VPENLAPDPHAGKLHITLGGITRLLTPAEAKQLAGLVYFPDDPRNRVIADNAHTGQSDYL